MNANASQPQSKKKRLSIPLVYVLSFLLPMISLLLIFLVKEIYPFGDRSFLRTDLYHQYAPFLAQFAEKLQNGESLLYSWEVGLGSNFITLLAYYLCSPFHILLYLISKPAVIEFVTYFVVFKTGLAGLTMSLYLCKKYDSRSLIAVLFAMGYSLSGYMAAYSWNIMWLDCIWLAPLVLLGLEELVERRKGLLYCVTLALSIFTNYYISIMLCLFLVLYFLCLLIQYPVRRQPEEIGKDRPTARDYLGICLRFAVYSLLAGGLCAVLLLPVMFALKTTASANMTFPTTLTSYFGVLDMLARHMAIVDVEIGLEHWPNIYCGAAVLLLAPLYIMNKNIPFKQKIVKSVLLFVLLVSFAWNIPNFIWHGFHYPNSLPCRQSFLYILILLSLCYEALLKLRTLSVAQIVGSLWGALAFIFVCEKLVDAEEFSFYAFYINAALVAVYGLFLYLYKRRKAALSGLAILSILMVFCEMTVNMGVTSITTYSRSQYLKGTDEYMTLAETAEELADGDFFRIEKDSRRTKNDGAWTGYRSASIFSSTTNAAITAVYKDLGLEGSTNAYSFTGATPFVSALLSVRYTLSSDTEGETSLQKLAATSGEYALYENLYTLPLGFLIPSQAAEVWYYNDPNPINVQNSFAALTTSVSDLFHKVDHGSSISYSFIAAYDGYYYGVLNDFSVDTITASYGDTSTSYSNVNRDFILDLGYLAAGESVTLTANDSKQVSVDIYRLDEEAFIQAVTELQETPLVIDSYSDTEIRGHISVEEAGILFTSIPYEEGWTAYVDGVQVETSAFAEAFISLDLSAGEHAILLQYQPVGLNEGAMISLACLCLLLILICLTVIRRRKAKKPDLEEQRRVRFPRDAQGNRIRTAEGKPSDLEAEPVSDHPSEAAAEEPARAAGPDIPEKNTDDSTRSKAAVDPARIQAFDQMMKDLGGKPL